MPPVAWHGKFATSPLATPDFAPTASPVASPIDATLAVASPSIDEPPMPPVPPATPPSTEASDSQLPPTVGALALDVYSTPRALPVEEVAQKPMLESVPQEVELDEYNPAVSATAPIERDEPLALIDLGTRPMLRRAVPHDELEPDVRAIVDDLYDQARAELSGTELTLFAPPIVDEPEPAVIEPVAPAVVAPVLVEPEPAVDPSPPLPEPPAAVVDKQKRARRGWVAAFVTDDHDGKHVTD
ncbi:MAG TPA: hypothetical protein VFU90_13125 [Candidatus Tumulicola sp.]|nr:hypothetical protein [Candidatus Tumulicola sp.]